MYKEKLFLDMITPQQYNYIDGATDFCLLIPFANEHKLNKSSRLWLAYLYGLSYSCTTTIRLFLEFNNPGRINLNELKEFWDTNKNTLYFSPDKARLKNSNYVVPAIENLINLLKGDSFLNYYKKVVGKNKSYKALEKEVSKNWIHFGYMGFYLFLDAVYGLCKPLYTDPDKISWKNSGKTVEEGMRILLGYDGESDYEKYNNAVKEIQNKTGQPKVIIESVLCAYCKRFKGTRYDGYYADRMLEECLKVSKFLSPDVSDIWRYRHISIPSHYLGEEEGWAGIRKGMLKPVNFSKKYCIYDIRGTCGSGKSSLVRNILKRYNNQVILDEEIPYHFIPDLNMCVLGRYDMQGSGIDNVKGADRVQAFMLKKIKEHNILLEGVMMAQVYTRWNKMSDSTEYQYRFFHLDVNIQTCIERVKERRIKRGDTKQLKTDNMIRFDKAIRRTIEKLQNNGRSVIIIKDATQKQAYQVVMRQIKKDLTYQEEA